MPPDPEQLPTEADFLDPRISNGLDLNSAIDRFLGKTSAEAEAMFRQCFLVFQEDLANMGPRAFRFYVKPAIRYLLSPDAGGDSDAASTFCSLVEWWLKRDAEALKPIAGTLAGTIREMLNDFDRFGCSQDIYGDVPARLNDLAVRLGA